MKAQTSDRISALAAAYIRTTPDDIEEAAADDRLAEKMSRDIRAMAASLMRQDETRGLRRFLKKIKGE